MTADRLAGVPTIQAVFPHILLVRPGIVRPSHLPDFSAHHQLAGFAAAPPCDALLPAAQLFRLPFELMRRAFRGCGGRVVRLPAGPCP